MPFVFFLFYRDAEDFVFFSLKSLLFAAAENYSAPVVELLRFTAHEINNSAKAEHVSTA